MTGFLTWLETDALEVKRQMDAQGDRIRVMTVHGAKGLEAPIVILPDCAKRPVRVNSELYAADGQMIWKPRADESPDAVVQLRTGIVAAQMRERMRLLYVAMTRAEKWLIVAAAGDVGEGDESWYQIAADGIERSGAVDETVGDMIVRRVMTDQWQPGDCQIKYRTDAPSFSAPTFAALPEVDRATTLSPSELGGAKILPGDPGGEDEDNAKARGTAMHLLLEHLPSLAPDQRAATGRTLLAAQPAFHDDAAADGLIRAAIAIIDAPDLAHIFTPDVLAEVSITAALPQLNGQRIHGQIDRLKITDDVVFAVDYKTNRLVPDDPEDTPEGVLRQQGAYAAGLGEIYPNHRIETAILWTETATLMPLPPPIIAVALARVTTS